MEDTEYNMCVYKTEAKEAPPPPLRAEVSAFVLQSPQQRECTNANHNASAQR